MTARLAGLSLAALLSALAACAPGAAATRPAAPASAAARLDPADQAFAARKARDFTRAEAIASAEIDAGRGGARLFFERAVARNELGKQEEALSDLRRLGAIQEDPQALLLAGAIELRLARWQDAEKDFARAAELSPRNARAFASLAQARLALRDLAGAATAHAGAVALAPADPYVREVGERLALATREAGAVQPAPPTVPTAAEGTPAKP